MKLRLIEEIEILTYKFKVEYDNKDAGGYFSFSERLIHIGTKHLKNNPEYVFMVLSHELMEVICICTATRYGDASLQDNYKFFMDHKEFENNMQIFSSTIQKFLK